MDLFLTSKIGASVRQNGKIVTGKLDDSLGFLTKLRDSLRGRRLMLYISSTPDHNEKVYAWFCATIQALAAEGIRFDENILINGENADSLTSLMPHTDAVFLSGGHLPTQNQFFRQIGLSKILQAYAGTIVAQSAGSMNCAGTAYICPELPGESIDPSFERFRPGLGLTNINIVPHYNVNHGLMLDGKRFYEDIIRPDTFRLPIYVLPDGSYFHIHEGIAEAFGEMYLFRQGVFTSVHTTS